MVVDQHATSKPSESHNPIIHSAAHIDLTSEIERLLRMIFSQYERLAIEAEFGQGLSGGRVFRVRPITAGGKVYLPNVVKIGPADLIQQEWTAYQTWVANALPGAARVESEPIFLSDGSWGGLRYTLAGEGVFKVQSLIEYYQKAGLEDLRWVLAERLQPMIGLHWWFERHPVRAFQMQADYDAILPPNLMLNLIDVAPDTSPLALTPTQLPPPSLQVGDIVRLSGFVVTEIDPAHGQLTLNLPRQPFERPTTAYRVRITHLPAVDQYCVGQNLDGLTGRVVATRDDILLNEVRQIFGEAFDLRAETIPISPTVSISPPPDMPAALPNPLRAYQEILRAFLTVNVSIIHGDLNLENILVDPETRHLNLIDFATVRQGHVLHDLLRLETEVVTKLIPEALAEAELPTVAVYRLYQHLHQLDQPTNTRLPAEQLPPALAKPFGLLAAIRGLARPLLFNSRDWTEYYQGLVLYLIGALKFANLTALPTAPLPKRTAFWAAAAAVNLLRHPPTESLVVETEGSISNSGRRSRRAGWLVLIIGGLLALSLTVFFVLLPVLSPPSSPFPGADSPDELLKTLIKVAQQQADYAEMSDLCDPLGEHDDNAAHICALATSADGRLVFQQVFGNIEKGGKIKYSPDGLHAEIPLRDKLSEYRTKPTVVQRDGRWYMLTMPPWETFKRDSLETTP